MLHSYIEIDLLSMSVPDSQQDVVRSDGDSLRSSKYEGLIVHFLCNHVQPGMEFFVVHLELVGADDGLASGVLDDTYNSLNSSNSFVMFGESDSEFYCCKLDVEL